MTALVAIAVILAVLNVLSIWAAVMINHDENDKEEDKDGH
jgi:hypothetical protein